MRKLILFVALAGCAQSSPPPPSPPPSAMMMGRGSSLGMCPLLQAGASVAAVDTPDGAALVVTAPESQRLAVRQYLRQMATHHEQTRVSGGPEHQEKLPAHSTAVEDIEQGGRVIFQPDDSAQLSELREGVRTHARELMVRCAKR